jgi:hypothetical protein
LGVLYKGKSVSIVAIEKGRMLKDLTIFSLGYLLRALIILATRKAIAEGMPKAMWTVQLFTYHILILSIIKAKEIENLNAIWAARFLIELIICTVNKLKSDGVPKAVGAILLIESKIISIARRSKDSGLHKAIWIVQLAKQHLSLLDRKPEEVLEGIRNPAGEDIIAESRIVASTVAVRQSTEVILDKNERIGLNKRVVEDEIVQT